MKARSQANPRPGRGIGEQAVETTADDGANRPPGRRQILSATAVGLVAAAGLGGTAAAAPSAPASGSAVPGGWLVTRHDIFTPVPIRSVFTFADGGAAVGLDLDPIAPPYLGSWAARDRHGFVVTFWTPITDDQGVSIGTARVKATGQVDHDKISGSYTGVVFLQGQQEHGSGTFHGTRIRPGS